MIGTRTLVWPVRALPRVRVAGVFALDARAFEYTYNSPTHALHLHDYRGTLRMGEVSLALSPGTVTLSPAEEDTCYDLPAPGTHWCIQFDPVTRGGRGAAVSVPMHRDMGTGRTVAADRFAHVVNLHAMGTSWSAHAASVALQDLLQWLALPTTQQPDGTSPASHAAVDALLAIIHRELHTALRVTELARRVGLSQNYLARLFRDRLGMTIPRYILTHRMDTARLLLSNTDLPVKQVAFRVGLPDPQYFNKQFRRVAGCSPSAARRRARRARR